MLRLRVDRNPEVVEQKNFEIAVRWALALGALAATSLREALKKQRTFPLEPIGMVVDVSTCALLCLLSCY